MEAIEHNQTEQEAGKFPILSYLESQLTNLLTSAQEGRVSGTIEW